MFGKAGLSIAMGNAAPEVRRAADFTTGRNDEEGFAQAIDRIILPRTSPSRRASPPGRDPPA
jgi:hydroxymethylpyrimidine pyrophosphatase-like HAD family hydrolase